MGSLKLDSEQLKSELLSILDSHPVLNTPEKLADAIRENGGTTSKSTLYAIINGERETTQRSTAIDIAKAAGLDYVIEGDKIMFRKKPATDTPTSRFMVALLKERGMNTAEICEKIGADPVEFEKYIRGETEPPLKVLFDLSKLFGISLESFVMGDETPEHKITRLVDELPVDKQELILKILNLAKGLDQGKLEILSRIALSLD